MKYIKSSSFNVPITDSLLIFFSLELSVVATAILFAFLNFVLYWYLWHDGISIFWIPEMHQTYKWELFSSMSFWFQYSNWFWKYQKQFEGISRKKTKCSLQRLENALLVNLISSSILSKLHAFILFAIWIHVFLIKYLIETFNIMREQFFVLYLLENRMNIGVS